MSDDAGHANAAVGVALGLILSFAIVAGALVNRSPRSADNRPGVIERAENAARHWTKGAVKEAADEWVDEKKRVLLDKLQPRDNEP